MRMRSSIALLALTAVVVSCIEVPEKLDPDEYAARQDAGVVEPPDVAPPDVEDANKTIDGQVDAEDVEADVPDMVDAGPPPCVPDPLGGDWCDGIDNDCDDQIDEDGGPPKVDENFSVAHGWVRTSPNGVLNHNGGLVLFAGYPDADTVVWLATNPWRGDLELSVKLVLSKLSPGAELYIGTWSGTEAPTPPVGRTGIAFVRATESTVLARALVNDEVVTEVEANPIEFLRVSLRLTTQINRLNLKLLKGDGSLVVEGVADNVAVVPEHAGLAMAVTGGAMIGSVSSLTLGPGLSCAAPPFAPECSKGQACDPIEDPCINNVCNPFLGCVEQPIRCALESPSLGASACAEGTCSEQPPKDDGTACDNGLGCTVGSTCAAGQCQGGEPTQCPEPGQCQEAGTCDTLTNACVFPAKNEGGECDDGVLCTENDVCTEGACAGLDKVCPENGPCESVSVCLPESGECSEVTPFEDGAACDDGDGCTVNDLCTENVCGGEPNPCDDQLACTADSCADGVCQHAATLEDCQAWEATLGGAITGPAAYGGGAALYLAAGKLYALTTDGTQVWESADVNGVTTPSPVIAKNGSRLYAGDVSDESVSRLVAVSAGDGELQWEFPVPGECVPGPGDPCRILSIPTEADAVVLAPTVEAGLYAINIEDGTQAWHLESTYIGSSVVVGANSALYVGQSGIPRGVLSLDQSGGARWKHDTDADVRATPVVAGDALYYVSGSSVGALKDNGDAAETMWTVDLETPLAALQPILGWGDALIVGAGDSIWALNTATCDGTAEACVLWSAPTGGTALSVGVTALNDGHLVLGAHPDTLVFLSIEDGAVALSVPIPGQSPTSPVVLDDGTLVVGGADGVVHGLGYLSGVQLSDTPWPVMNRQQSRNPLAQ